MKATSGHFIFKKNFSYKQLAKVFPEILRTFLEETEQMPEDEDILQMFIYLNRVELERDRKPEGYNRKGKMKLIFPIGRSEFYVKGTSKGGDVVRVAEKLSRLLTKAGVAHDLEWDASLFIEE